jgi:GTP-sensing pleiotropic transcriptional regulator CodY
MKLVGPPRCSVDGAFRLTLADEIERHCRTDEILQAAASTLSPSWRSMARRIFPSRLELNGPEGSFNAAPLANVILTTLLYVSPVGRPFSCYSSNFCTL